MKKENNNNGINVKLARLEEKLIASEKALEIANQSMQARLGTMNEFREQLKDQAATFISRVEFETKLGATEKGKKDNIALFLSVLGIVAAFISVIIHLLK